MFRNAIELAGGKEALKLNRRLRLRMLSRVLEALRLQLGIPDPLSEIRLERIGSCIFAHVSGAKLDPVKSQYVFAEIMSGVKTYLKESPNRGPKKKLRDIRQQKQVLAKPRGFFVKSGIRVPF
jgi:hypothetical protein